MNNFHSLLIEYNSKEDRGKKISIPLKTVDDIKFTFFGGFENDPQDHSLKSRLERAKISKEKLESKLKIMADFIKQKGNKFAVYYLTFTKSKFKVFIRYFSRNKNAEIITILPPYMSKSWDYDFAKELMEHFEEIGLSFADNNGDVFVEELEDDVKTVIFTKTHGIYEITGDLILENFDE